MNTFIQNDGFDLFYCLFVSFLRINSNQDDKNRLNVVFFAKQYAAIIIYCILQTEVFNKKIQTPSKNNLGFATCNPQLIFWA